MKSQGCLLGVMSSLLYRAAVTTVTAARLVGGVEVADVVREVWGEDGGDALQAWMLEKESDAQRHLRHQVCTCTDIRAYTCMDTDIRAYICNVHSHTSIYI